MHTRLVVRMSHRTLIGGELSNSELESLTRDISCATSCTSHLLHSGEGLSERVELLALRPGQVLELREEERVLEDPLDRLDLQGRNSIEKLKLQFTF